LTDLNVTAHVFFIIIIECYFDFCCFKAMTQQSILRLVVNLEVFTMNQL